MIKSINTKNSVIIIFIFIMIKSINITNSICVLIIFIFIMIKYINITNGIIILFLLRLKVLILKIVLFVL